MIDLPRRGDIWLVRLDPTVGSEIKKTRPALVISNNTANQYSDLATVLPISDRGSKIFPFEADLPASTPGLTKHSKIKCHQVRSVDKQRLLKKMGAVDREIILKIEDALKLHLGLY